MCRLSRSRQEIPIGPCYYHFAAPQLFQNMKLKGELLCLEVFSFIVSLFLYVSFMLLASMYITKTCLHTIDPVLPFVPLHSFCRNFLFWFRPLFFVCLYLCSFVPLGFCLLLSLLTLVSLFSSFNSERMT